MSAPAAPLGTASTGEPFAIDVGRLVGGHTALIANSGAGKTRSVRKLLEATHGQIQHIVLDDELDFYTLRERFDYVIVGGENGDCPLSVASAEPLALALLENGLSAIIQTGAFDTADEGQEFVARFLMALLKAPRRLWHPALVVLDEAQRFAPNDGLALSSKAVAEFAASARKRGFTLVAATGRFSSLSTKVRGHVVNWLIGRAGGELDVRTAAGALGFRPTSAEARGIPALALGQLWAFGPALASVPTLVQFGAVATSHLVPGQAPVPTPPPPAKLRKILAGLAAAAAAPAAPAETSTAGAPQAPARVSAAELAVAERRGFQRGLAEGEAKGVRLVREYVERIPPAIAEALRVVAGEMELGPPATRAPAPPAPTRPDEAEKAARAAALADAHQRATAAKANGAHHPDIPPAKQRILDAIVWMEEFSGMASPPREAVAFIAGASSRSSSFANNLGGLRTAGLIDYPAGGTVALTEAGRARAARPGGAVTHAAIAAAVREKLVPAQWRILEALIGIYPNHADRIVMADNVGVAPASSSYANNLGRLRSLGLITYPAGGRVRAADLLFPAGAGAR